MAQDLSTLTVALLNTPTDGRVRADCFLTSHCSALCVGKIVVAYFIEVTIIPHTLWFTPCKTTIGFQPRNGCSHGIQILRRAVYIS